MHPDNRDIALLIIYILLVVSCPGLILWMASRNDREPEE